MTSMQPGQPEQKMRHRRFPEAMRLTLQLSFVFHVLQADYKLPDATLLSLIACRGTCLGSKTASKAQTER